jgi:branched-chain amino acid transport system ATP-binding protein
MSALTVSSLSKAFGGLRVTSGVNLDVQSGERRLIIGPNGAGKTTLFNLITGELTPDAGSISLLGSDITRVPSRRRPHLGMARTYQIITLCPHDTIIHNVSLALLGLSPLRWNPLIGMRGQSHIAERAREALARVGLGHIADRPLSQTSYGERRRVEIAMALAQNPKVLLLDEPFAPAFRRGHRGGQPCGSSCRSAHAGGLSWPLARSSSATLTRFMATAMCSATFRLNWVKHVCSAYSAATGPVSRPA